MDSGLLICFSLLFIFIIQLLLFSGIFEYFTCFWHSAIIASLICIVIDIWIRTVGACMDDTEYPMDTDDGPDLGSEEHKAPI